MRAVRAGGLSAAVRLENRLTHIEDMVASIPPQLVGLTALVTKQNSRIGSLERHNQASEKEEAHAAGFTAGWKTIAGAFGGGLTLAATLTYPVGKILGFF